MLSADATRSYWHSKCALQRLIANGRIYNCILDTRKAMECCVTRAAQAECSCGHCYQIPMTGIFGMIISGIPGIALSKMR